jgi:glycosyltransferase involved in cell wall biosynthesis/predicted GH43/DUF377 family glycosyl hydrolase
MLVHQNKSLWIRLLYLCLILISGTALSNPPLLPGTFLYNQSAGNAKICLTMIVKNEEKIIERCLDSVKDIVDAVCICDTGSTDDTVEIVQNYLEKNGIPGKVCQHVWKNFGHNRSLSASAAQTMLQELGFPLHRTYLLFIDADMIFKIEPDFTKKLLMLDEYYLLQKSYSQSYYNLRLGRASLPWECVGVTHEYWSCKKTTASARLTSLWIDDRNDGGAKADKFERDIRLLTQGLEDEPDNVRYMFYLAQSYKSIQNYEDSIQWYTKRFESGGWQEEVWFSKFMIGECYECLGDWNSALSWYLEAYYDQPHRAEPLRNIAAFYRKEKKHILAYLFAKQGLEIPYPVNDMLFVSHAVYDYQFDEELSIAAYYTSFKEEGFEAANRLVLNKKVPWNIKDQTYKNMLFYVKRLESDSIVPITIDLPLIREGFPDHYNPMNPTIQKTKTGYSLICRTVNYKQDRGLNFHVMDPLDSTVRTKNFLVEYDKNFNKLSQKEIIEMDRASRYPTYQARIRGLEDCRLFNFSDHLWFFCTTVDTNPHDLPQISLCRLASNSSGSTIPVERFTLLKSLNPDQKRPEKNWLPFVKDNELYCMYMYDPWTIYKPNVQTGSCEEVVSSTVDYDFSNFRGSAAPIELDDGYLILVHEVAFNEARYYIHRFLYMDRDFKITKLSKPFIFQHEGIEYSCGMTIDHSGTKLIIPIGIEDREAYLCTVDLNVVRNILEPLPNLKTTSKM